MQSFLASALAAIPSAATSKLALAAYAFALITYLASVYRVTRNKNLLRYLERLPEGDRLGALEIEMGGVQLASGITAEQWVKSRIHKYHFSSLVILCLVIVLVLGYAVWISYGTSEISVDLYQKSDDTTQHRNLQRSSNSPRPSEFIGSAEAAETAFVDPNTIDKINEENFTVGTDEFRLDSRI